jgi:hypothetical protein
MVNKTNKAVDSNQITNWTKINPFSVTGKIKELQ